MYGALYVTGPSEHPERPIDQRIPYPPSEEAPHVREICSFSIGRNRFGRAYRSVSRCYSGPRVPHLHVSRDSYRSRVAQHDREIRHSVRRCECRLENQVSSKPQAVYRRIGSSRFSSGRRVHEGYESSQPFPVASTGTVLSASSTCKLDLPNCP